MKIKSTLVALAAFSAAVASSHAALIAHWNFNGYDKSSTPISASSGTGSIILSGFTGTLDNFAGDTLNRVGTDVAGESLSLVSNTGNDSFIDVSFSSVGLSNIILTFATRGTGTGYDSGVWTYSTNGTNFFATSAGNTSSNSSSWATRTVDLTGVTAAENATTLTLRYTVSGATTSGGNNRIDNLQINAVPEPSTALLSALGALALIRRRR